MTAEFLKIRILISKANDYTFMHHEEIFFSLCKSGFKFDFSTGLFCTCLNEILLEDLTDWRTKVCFCLKKMFSALIQDEVEIKMNLQYQIQFQLIVLKTRLDFPFLQILEFFTFILHLSLKFHGKFIFCNVIVMLLDRPFYHFLLQRKFS